MSAETPHVAVAACTHKYGGIQFCSLTLLLACASMAGVILALSHGATCQCCVVTWCNMSMLQENLRWEQRTVLQFNWVLVNRIMSPIQTALFMVHAWPSHCDCLALVNAVNAIKEELLVSQAGSPGNQSVVLHA